MNVTKRYHHVHHTFGLKLISLEKKLGKTYDKKA